MSNPQIILTAGRCLKPVERWYNITEADKLSTKPTWVLYLYTDKSEYMLAIWQLHIPRSLLQLWKMAWEGTGATMGLIQGEQRRGLGLERKVFLYFSRYSDCIYWSAECAQCIQDWGRSFCNYITSIYVSADKYLCGTKILLYSWLESLNKKCDVYKAT